MEKDCKRRVGLHGQLKVPGIETDYPRMDRVCDPGGREGGREGGRGGMVRNSMGGRWVSWGSENVIACVATNRRVTSRERVCSRGTSGEADLPHPFASLPFLFKQG